MQQLILLRHSKSDGVSGAGSDFMWPLAAQGRGDLPDIAIALRPYLTGSICCLCSSALRTLQTIELACDYWPEITPIFVNSFYEFGASAIEKEVNKAAETADTIMVIGHNSGLSQILQKLQPARPFHMPTSCAAILQNKDSGPASPMQLIGFFTPENVAQGKGCVSRP
jgi:phosphohistidine phosphatase